MIGHPRSQAQVEVQSQSIELLKLLSAERTIFERLLLLRLDVCDDFPGFLLLCRELDIIEIDDLRGGDNFRTVSGGSVGLGDIDDFTRQRVDLQMMLSTGFGRFRVLELLVHHVSCIGFVVLGSRDLEHSEELSRTNLGMVCRDDRRRYCRVGAASDDTFELTQ